MLILMLEDVNRAFVDKDFNPTRPGSEFFTFTLGFGWIV